jgi:hypothetical protein
MSLTNRDPNQITQFEHDDSNNAKRVVVVGQEFSIDSDKIAQAVKDGLSSITLPALTGDVKASLIQSEPIERTIFIPQFEIKTVEVPVIVKEIEYREIQVPVIIEKIVHIEVPVIVKEYEIKYINNESTSLFSLKMGTIVRDVCMLGLMIYHLFSHLK